MTKEFNLSEKRKELFEDFNVPEEFREIIEKQDKEFIKLLKQEIWIAEDLSENLMSMGVRINEALDKLAGDKLR